MPMANNIFKDEFVTIHDARFEDDDVIAICEWIPIRAKPLNMSYMEAKLMEYIGNEYPGAWPIRKIEDNKENLRCFLIEHICEDGHKEKIIARWIK